MDPNAALAAIRDGLAAIDAIRDGSADPDANTYANAAADIVEHTRALDEWLSKGGFPPNAWTETPVAFPTREQIAETLARVGRWDEWSEDDALELADGVLALFTTTPPNDILDDPARP